MFDKNDLLARLQNGESAEAIAQEMADALNGAQDAYIQEQKNKEAAEKAAATREADLNQLALTIGNALIDYANVYKPGQFEEDEIINAKDIRDLLDPLLDMVIAANDFSKLIEGKNISAPQHRAAKPKQLPRGDQEVINAFLKSLGI